MTASVSSLQAIGFGWIIAAAICGYLLGSVPFGLIFTRLAGYGDVRHIGSGNVGATNVLRTGNRKLAALTLLFDMAKGLLPAAFFMTVAFNLGTFAGFCAFLGHIFPVWLKFKGGKGVATYLGVLAAVAGWVALLFILIWGSATFLGRYSSLSALMAAFIIPIIAFFILPFLSFFLIAVMSILIFVRHKDNIIRLINGTENRIKSKS